MLVASFFSGIGGFDLGLELAGMQIVFQCEVNSFSRSVLHKHWPTIPLHGDIATLEASSIPESDLWCAGFPCQDLSSANQGKRKGLNGNRSGLFYEFARLVKQRQPKWVIMENVPGLLNSKEGEDFRNVLKKLDELGYGVAWRVLDAKFFGTPQRRRRVFIVASYNSTHAIEVFFSDGASSIAAKKSSRQETQTTPPTRECHQPTTFNFGENASTGSNHNATSSSQECKEGKEQRIENRKDGGNLYTIQNAAIGRKHSSGPQGSGYRNDGETWTLDSRGSADAICSTHDPFGVREATGLPGRMDSNRYRSLGNAVPVPVIEWLGKRIIEVDDKYRQQPQAMISFTFKSTHYKKTNY
ncbi:MAG: DNA (cytosine-5-)-methyltransferase [Chloroflexota bacterium]